MITSQRYCMRKSSRWKGARAWCFVGRGGDVASHHQLVGVGVTCLMMSSSGEDMVGEEGGGGGTSLVGVEGGTVVVGIGSACGKELKYVGRGSVARAVGALVVCGTLT